MWGAAQAALALAHRRRERSLLGAPFTLVVGHYPGHLELALCRDERFHYALHAPRATPADSAYFAAALLERLGTTPSAVGRILAYGFDTDDPDAFAALDHLTGILPQPLDFRPAVGLEPDRLATGFEAGTYVPCIGAAL